MGGKVQALEPYMRKVRKEGLHLPDHHIERLADDTP